jgi:hypothetical protein
MNILLISKLYNNIDNMNPKIWGRHIWKSLHLISLGYPSKPEIKDKKDYYAFFMNVGNVLPCETCRNNYYKHLKELPLDDAVMSSKEALVKWVIDLHNIVNRDLGKKIIPYPDALILISENKDYKELVYYVSIFFVILILVYAGYYASKKLIK